MAHDVPLQTVEKKEEQSVVPSLSMRVSLLEGQLLLRNSEIARLQREVEGIYDNMQLNVRRLLLKNGGNQNKIKKLS